MQAAPLPIPSLAPPPRPRWVDPAPADPRLVDALVGELRLPVTLCTLLVRRGYGSPADVKAFLRPHRGQIHPPQALRGMAEAVARLRFAISERETILVHGDYDVDGVCSTALLVRALRAMGGVAVPFVPNRLTDGYDLSRAGLRAARNAGATLIVTADCGIVAHQAVAEAAAAGIDVVITDHHTPHSVLPSAVSVINPNRSDCGYPDKGLAGVGVAYKLACALAAELRYPEERLVGLLDLVAIATIADLAPLAAENRALVRWGLAVLARTPNPGLRALLRTTRLAERNEITAGQVGFVLAPRINAAGRMGEAMRAVRLLLTDDPAEAEALAQLLESENRLRRETDEETLADVMRMLEHGYDPVSDWGVVLASERWHPGVIGIVASRVVERIHRPTVLIALGGEEGRGSARSIRGFHLHRAFVACAPHLIRFGGHRAAAGCSIQPANVPAFRDAFNSAARSALNPEMLQPEIRLDGELRLAEANVDLVRLLRHLAPFGIGNGTPVFAARSVRMRGEPRVVGATHLKLTLADEDARLDAIGFGMADRIDECRGSGRLLDVAFRLEENHWQPARGPACSGIQARLVDLRPPAP